MLWSVYKIEDFALFALFLELFFCEFLVNSTLSSCFFMQLFYSSKYWYIFINSVWEYFLAYKQFSSLLTIFIKLWVFSSTISVFYFSEASSIWDNFSIVLFFCDIICVKVYLYFSIWDYSFYLVLESLSFYSYKRF